MQMISAVTQVGQGITCLQAANPSPMTASGTNTYLVQGPTGAVVIDPGPDLDDHLHAILAACAGQQLEAILVTHAHLDHSALAPRLAARTGAPVLGFGRVTEGRSARMQALAEAGLTDGGEGLDHGFDPDIRIADGQILRFGGLQLEVLATPGHLSGHLSFATDATVFTGDHVMGWSTSLISPPEGDMATYMASLRSLQGRHWHRFLPGHGPEISAPAVRLRELIAHREAREAAVLTALRNGPASPKTLTAKIYTQTPPALLAAAERNILAHLIDLHDRNQVMTRTPLGPQTLFELI